MRSALSTIRHRIVQSDDALYLTIGQVRKRFGGISAMWVVRRMVSAGVPPDQIRPPKIRTTVLEARRHQTMGTRTRPHQRRRVMSRHEQRRRAAENVRLLSRARAARHNRTCAVTARVVL